MESIHIPLISSIENKLESNKAKIKSIKEEKEKLKKEFESFKKKASTSSGPLISHVSASVSQTNVQTLQNAVCSNVHNMADDNLIISPISPPIIHSSSPNNSSRINITDIKSPKKMYGETSI